MDHQKLNHVFFVVVVCLFTADKKVFKKELLRGVKSFKGEWKKRCVSMCCPVITISLKNYL